MAEQHAHEHISRVDHVAIALESVADSVPLFIDALGARFLTGGDNRETGIRLVHLQFPGLKLELMQPLRDDSILAHSLAGHGPGFHHMTFFVDDVAKTATALEADGLPTTGTDLSTETWMETFIRPRASFGALLQFVSSTRTWGVPTEDFTLDDVLAGDVVWRDHLACLERSADLGPA
jgi:methylmalonyl-CoA/ethylmalonyl-CoA epimerase